MVKAFRRINGEMAKLLISLLSRIKRRPEPASVIDIQPDTPEWEALCRRCGECCYELVFDEDDKLTASTICEYLDPDTRQCRVYDTRFEVCHDCIKLTAENLPTFDWLPETCGYVVRFGTRAGKRGQ